MELLISLVAVKKITCQSPRSLFSDVDIEEAAKLILASEGVINPIIVRRTSLKSYEVVEGAFEYYAAARAREIDAKKGEMIGVFIMEEDNEELLIQQIKRFRGNNYAPTNQTSSEGINMNYFLNELESRFDKITHQLLKEATEKVKLEYENNDLRKKLTKKVDILESFNQLDASQLTLKLKSTGISEARAIKIADAVITDRKRNKFESLKDLGNRVKIKGKRAISEKKMLDIVDSWLNDS